MSAEDEEAARKRKAGLQAACALRGIALEQLADGQYLAQKWGLFKTFATEAEVEALLVKVGARLK